MGNDVLVDVQDLRREFVVRRNGPGSSHYKVRAVDGVTLQLVRGETLAVVGESGCGKSTLGRLLMGLIEPTSGRVTFDGKSLLELEPRERRLENRRIQFVFQDPTAAFNPRMRVGELVEEPMLLHGVPAVERKRRVLALLPKVGLNAKHVDRFPAEFSGGQRQRIGLARALSVKPELVICDEPVSALDVSIQAQVINLLVELQRDFGLTYLFISHDLRVVRHISTRVAVMYLGRIVEMGDTDKVYTNPLHPYTKALISAVPLPDPNRQVDRAVLVGEIPTAQNIPSGCRFHTRCPIAMDVCRVKDPVFTTTADGRSVACHAVT